MARYRVFLVLLLLAWSAGCGASHRRRADDARWQRGEHDGQCRGELILVEAPSAGSDLAPGQSASADGPHWARTVPPAVIEVARRFTVAVRGQRRPDRKEPAGEHALVSEAEPTRPVPLCIEGSGVVIDRDGLVLTNHHVVRDAADLEIWIPSVGWRPARVVGVDTYGDLAIIKVDARLCCAARLADADTLRVGQPVVALGHTPGEDMATAADALTGRLTGLHRSLQSALDPTHNRYYGDLLESTVPLKPGHSGGALIDRSGAVVGISTAAVMHRRTGHRNGYAIPMSGYVRSVIERLVRGRPVVHGYLGLLVSVCAADGGGVRVERLVPGGPAQRAGLRAGDTIISFHSTPVRSAAHLSNLVRGGPIGQSVPVRVRRGRQTVQLTCVLEAHPSSLQ